MGDTFRRLFRPLESSEFDGSKRKLHQLFGEGLSPGKRGKDSRRLAPQNIHIDHPEDSGFLGAILEIERILGIVDSVLA